MTTVNWVQDGNGNYEVSSPEHLKQLMNEGSLYTDAVLERVVWHLLRIMQGVHAFQI